MARGVLLCAAVVAAIAAFTAPVRGAPMRASARDAIDDDPFARLPKAEFAWEQAIKDMTADEGSSAHAGSRAMSAEFEEDLALMQLAARSRGKHAVKALERLAHRARAGASHASGALASSGLPPSRLECSCRFADETNPVDNPQEAS